MSAQTLIHPTVFLISVTTTNQCVSHPALFLLLLGLLLFKTAHTWMAGGAGEAGDALWGILAIDQQLWQTRTEDSKLNYGRKVSEIPMFAFQQFSWFNSSNHALISSISCTFRCDVWITESPLNDFLGLCIFGLQNLNGLLQLSELRVLEGGNIDMYSCYLAGW